MHAFRHRLMNLFTGLRAHRWGWLGLGLMLAMPTLAFAQSSSTTNLFTVPSTDQSMVLFINKIFGDFSNSPLGGAVGVFNSAVLFVGGILAAYTILAGTMATAHDGEALGQRWSSMWIPLRTSVGTAMVLPVVNGFCAAQSIVLWLATQGIGLADAIWDQFTDNPIQSMTVTTAGVGSRVTNMALAMLESNVCIQSAQAHSTDDTTNGTGFSFGTPTYGVTTTNPSGSSTNMVYQYGDTTGVEGIGGSAVCGQATLDTSTASAVPTTGFGSVDALSANADSIGTAVSAAQLSAFQTLQSSMASAATSFLANPNSFDVVGAVTAAATAYQTTVANAANSAVSSSNVMSTFTQNVQTDGWMFAGAWYMKLLRLQDSVNSAINRTAQTTPPTNVDMLFSNDTVNDLQKLANAVVTQASKASTTSGLATQALADMGSSPSTKDSGDKDGIIQRLTNKINVNPQAMLAGAMGPIIDTASNLNDPTKNGLLAAKGLGDNMIDLGWVVALLGGAVSFFPGGGGYASILTGLATTLWVEGAALAIALPMMPFIMWVGMVIGWLIQVVEAIFAAPLWAVVHLHPDGDGVVGRGGSGYMLVLSLTLKPALMIMGLVSAIVLMDPITQFVNATFFGAFRLMQGNTLTGPVTIVAAVAMYCSAMFMVIKKTFSLMHYIPDQILNWIGGGGPQLGPSAQEGARAGERMGESGRHTTQIGTVLAAGGLAGGVAGAGMLGLPVGFLTGAGGALGAGARRGDLMGKNAAFKSAASSAQSAHQKAEKAEATMTSAQAKASEARDYAASVLSNPQSTEQEKSQSMTQAYQASQHADEAQLAHQSARAEAAQAFGQAMEKGEIAKQAAEVANNPKAALNISQTIAGLSAAQRINQSKADGAGSSDAGAAPSSAPATSTSAEADQLVQDPGNS